MSILRETVHLIKDIIWDGIQTSLFWIADDLKKENKT